MRPTRASLAGPPVLIKQLCPYVVLLRMGFTLPVLSPDLRCALTAPFHPYITAPKGGMRFVFCGTFPRVAPAGRYPASWSCEARTFLHRHAGSSHPAICSCTHLCQNKAGKSNKADRSHKSGRYHIAGNAASLEGIIFNSLT